MHFATLKIWEIRLQSSNLILPLLSLKISFPLSLPLHSFSPTFKLLSMASYGGELLLDSSSPWSGISNLLSSFFISLPLIFKKQMTPLMKKIQGLQALHGATLHFNMPSLTTTYENEYYAKNSLDYCLTWHPKNSLKENI